MNEKQYKRYLMICISLLVMGNCTACKKQSYFQKVSESNEDTQEEQSDTKESSETENSDDSLYVQVSGAVKNPGVYEFLVGSRVCDAIKKAGGLTAEADEESLNQAAKLQDEQKLVVLTREQAKVQEEIASKEANVLVNLNTASEEELMTLTGVGESKAKAIISYRNEKGFFSTIEEIMNISGIKEGAFNKIKNDITVN